MNDDECLKMYLLEEKHFWFIGKRLFLKRYLDIIKPFISSILDIGSGTAGTTKWLSQYGDVVGLEKNPYCIHLGKKRGVRIIPGKAQNVPFKDKSFDLVTLLDVLYHELVPNVKTVLKEACRVLKPGGYLLITDSALPFLYSTHDKFLNGKRRFTLNQFDQLLSDLNFKIIKSSYIFFFLFPLILIKRKMVDVLFPAGQSNVQEVGVSINRLLILILTFESILLKKISFPIGSSIIILAKKEK